MNYLNSPLGDNRDDEPASWPGNLLIAVLLTIAASAAYWWGTQ